MKNYKTIRSVLLLIFFISLAMASPWIIDRMDYTIESTPMATLRGDDFRTMTLEYRFLPIKIVGEDKIWMYSICAMLFPGSIALLILLFVRYKHRRRLAAEYYDYYR